MRKLVLGLIGASALAMASGANATLLISSTSGIVVAGPTTSDNVNYSFGYTGSGTTSPFTETVQWMNTLAGTYGITLSTVATTINGPDDVDITSAFITGTGIGTPIALGTDFNNDLIEDYSLTNLALAAGTYTLTIEGTRGDNGSYGGNVAFSALSHGGVPEPATWLMMLLGFGAVGWRLRRRIRPALAQAA